MTCSCSPLLAQSFVRMTCILCQQTNAIHGSLQLWQWSCNFRKLFTNYLIMPPFCFYFRAALQNQGIYIHLNQHSDINNNIGLEGASQILCGIWKSLVGLVFHRTRLLINLPCVGCKLCHWWLRDFDNACRRREILKSSWHIEVTRKKIYIPKKYFLNFKMVIY